MKPDRNLHVINLERKEAEREQVIGQEIVEGDREMAMVCAGCMLCQNAREKQKGLAY